MSPPVNSTREPLVSQLLSFMTISSCSSGIKVITSLGLQASGTHAASWISLYESSLISSPVSLPILFVKNLGENCNSETIDKHHLK